MANKRLTAGTLTTLLITLAIAVGLGVGTTLSFQATAALQDLRDNAQAEVVPLDWTNGYTSNGDPARIEVGRLDREIWVSEQTTDKWITALAVYVLIVLGLAALFATLAIVVKVAELAKSKFSERRVGEQLNAKVTIAADAIERAMAPKATLGGGRHSTADELRKWTALHDEGLVTDEEFAKMRARLLQ